MNQDSTNQVNPDPSPAPINTAPQQPKKSRVGLIIGLVVGFIFLMIVILVVIGVVAFKGAQKKADDARSDTQGASSQVEEDTASTANAVTAKYVSDFDAVCDRGSVSNAAEKQKPYKVAAFYKTNATNRDSWSETTIDYDSPHRSNEPTEINVVACLEEKSGTAEKIKTCEFTSGGEKTEIDFYAVQYDLVFKEAKTGKTIEEAGVVNGPATSCPMFVSYDKSDPKLHAKPDSNAVTAAVAAFGAK